MDVAPLTVEEFGRRYRRGGPWAVRGVSFSLSPGTITALVGPNGAGKSTLVRACIGFEPLDQGRVVVGGHNLATDRARAVEAIGYVPQSPSLYRSLTVADHLTMAQAARASFDRPYALTLIHAARLSESRRVGELSGGEQAQVALALALGTRSRLLLLDEPLASLDPLARREFLTAAVRDVRGRGATAMLSSHIVTDAEQVCDHVLILVAGRLVLDTSIDAAKRDFVTIPASGLNGRAPVGVFSGPGGERLALVAAPAHGRAASLEEIVLAHLAGVSS